jgi:hypothetical protein
MGFVNAVNYFPTRIRLRSDFEDLLDVMHLAEDVTLRQAPDLFISRRIFNRRDHRLPPLAQERCRRGQAFSANGHAAGGWIQPRVINVDGCAAYPQAIREIKAIENWGGSANAGQLRTQIMFWSRIIDRKEAHGRRL